MADVDQTTRVEQWHRQAQGRWPRVGWPLERYRAHVGEDRPAHPLDLYLAGAAGCRVDEAWVVLDSEFGGDIQRILSRQPLADFTPEELWAETIAKLLEADPALVDGKAGGEAGDVASVKAAAAGVTPTRLIRYRGLVALRNYLLVVAKRMAIARNRRRRPELSLTDGRGDESDQSIGTKLESGTEASPDEQMESSEDAMLLARALTAGMRQLNEEQRFLIRMVFDQGMAQKDAGAMIGFNESKTSRQIKAAMQTLRDAMTAMGDVKWTSQVEAVWSSCWSQSWNQQAAKAG